MKTDKIYGIADKAWQCVVGCDPHMSCAPRCWARRTVARIVECQKGTNPEREQFFQKALTPDRKCWSGNVSLDERHLADPLKWRNPAVVATGFHGDWARLPETEQSKILTVVRNCERHDFMMLTKAPWMLWRFLAGWRSLGNMTIGCSVMNQAEASKMWQSMEAIHGLGWRTHVWYEPAIGPVDWNGWEFIEQIIVGGESGHGARPFDVKWARDTRNWAATAGVAFWMKQFGAVPMQSEADWRARPTVRLLNDRNRDKVPADMVPLLMYDPKGGDMDEWYDDLRIRQLPEVPCA